MERHPRDAAATSRALPRLSRLVCSRKAVAVLLALLVGLCLAGVLLPQRGSPSHAPWRANHPRMALLVGWVGLDAAFTSPPFIALLGVGGLSIAVFLLVRLRDLRLVWPGRGLLRVLLARRRLLGSLVFHAGLLGIVLAGAISALTRCEGTLLLTEGQVAAVDARPAGKSLPSKRGSRPPAPFQVRLDKFHPVFRGRFGSPDYASDVTVLEDGREVRRATVRVNEPLVHRGVTLYQELHGFSPLVVLTDAQGRRRFHSWVALHSDVEADPVRYRDDFVIPGTTLAVEAEFFPDAYLVGNRLASRSPVANNPALEVTVRDGVDTVYEGPVYLGQPVELQGGLRLKLADVRYWSRFDTVRDQGVGALFVCAWIAVGGLCVRFAPQRKRWDATPAGRET